MQAAKKAAKRFAELAEQAGQFRDTLQKHPSPLSEEVRGDAALCVQWHTSALHLIEGIYGRDSAYHVRLASAKGIEVGCRRAFLSAWGAFQAAKADFDAGYAQRFEDMVAAEVFDDFLEMAEYLCGESTGYYPAAAALAGGVLEDFLRRLCDRHQVPQQGPSSISKLNDALKAAQVYAKPEWSQVQAWSHIRNACDHGRFEEVCAEQVDIMIKGVRDFIARQSA